MSGGGTLLWEALGEQCVFAYLPQLEPLLAAYCLMERQPVHNLCLEIYGAAQIEELQRKYRFLFETHEAISRCTILGALEFLLDVPLQSFRLSAFGDDLLSQPDEVFLSKYLGGLEASGEDWARALTDDEALDAIYRRNEASLGSFLGFSAFVRGSGRYRRELLALAGELNTPELAAAIEAAAPRCTALRETLRGEIEDLGALECSQLHMGKRFRNRGPYEMYYFLPSLLLPARAVRFFPMEAPYTRQILLLTLREIQGSQDDTLAALKVLSDKTRYRILILLAQGTPLRGLDIAKRLQLAPSTVSHHMEQLKERGLITEEPDGNSKYYGICTPNLEALLRTLEQDFKLPETPPHP